MSKDYKEFMAEDRRLVILRFLSEISGNAANESVLETSLDAIGHKATRATIRKDINFLSDAGCLSIEWFGDTVMVAILTRRGQYVAQGKVSVEGIKSPSL